MPGRQRARRAVLEALLGGTPLPGSASPLVFPDLADLASGRSVVLVDPETADSVSGLPDNLRVVPDAEQASHLEPGTAVLQWLPPESLPRRTSTRLRVSLLGHSGRAVPLGEIVVSFVDGPAGELRTTDPTHVLAY